MSSEVKTVAK